MNAFTNTDKEGKQAAKVQANKDAKKVDKIFYEKQTDLSKRPVILDGIHKEVISRERRLQSDWDKKYGHLSGEFFQRILTEEAVNAGLPADTFKRKKPEDPTEKSPIPLKASPPFPKTSSSIVGWRSARKQCNLEFTGRMYISPKHTIEPPLEGEFRITHQRFIFLG